MKRTLIFLAALAIPALASAQTADPCATAPASCATLIETHASSETRIANTAVDVGIGVMAVGKDMAEVQRTLTEKSNALLAYLKAQKVDRLMTSRVWFAPETKSDKNGPDKTVGYTGNSTLSFRTTPEKAGDLLAGVLSNGANQIQSTTFTPTEQEIDDARRRLSEEATHTAVEQASAIAKAAGMKVVSIRNIMVNDDGGIRPIPFNGAMAMARVAAPTAAMDTAAGDQQLSVRVNITAAATR
jgi:uncharacterized protein YggE